LLSLSVSESNLGFLLLARRFAALILEAFNSLADFCNVSNESANCGQKNFNVSNQIIG